MIETSSTSSTVPSITAIATIHLCALMAVAAPRIAAEVCDCGEEAKAKRTLRIDTAAGRPVRGWAVADQAGMPRGAAVRSRGLAAAFGALQLHVSPAPDATPCAAGSSVRGNPAAILEPDPQLRGDLVGGRIGAALESRPAARRAIQLRAADDDQPDRIGRGYGHCRGHDQARRFIARRGKRARTELAPSLRSYRIAFDHGVHLGGAGAESDDHALDHAAGATALGGNDIAADYGVPDLRRRSGAGLNCGHA